MATDDKKLDSHQLRVLKSLMNEFFINSDDTKLRNIFEYFDRDGNERLEPDELKVVMEQILRERITDDDVRQMMREADTNKNGTIEYSEFAEIMLRIRRNTQI